MTVMSDNANIRIKKQDSAVQDKNNVDKEQSLQFRVKKI